MRFMNDYDLEYARIRFTRSAKPNRLALVMAVDHLREWADTHSDGWAYWPKPCRAAEQAIRLIESTTSEANDEQERVDITEAQMLAAVRPIKAFLTRQKVTSPWRERILRSTQEIS
jgi:hypothetical protein